MEKNKKTLVLVDGSSYLHRAFHALPSLTNTKGEPTGAIYGVVNMLQKTLDDYSPIYIAVVFDAKGKNFRHELYPEYKANRPPMDEELRKQIEPIYEIIKAMGIELVTVEGVEADDVIGTIAKAAASKDLKIIISTGDKDLAQLVNQDITLVNTMSNSVLDEAGVVAKFGVKPDQIIDYLTLVGDSSDNISGVSGVGPKTAVKWLQEYGSLDNIIKHQDEIGGKVGKNLKDDVARLPLVRELVTIRDNLKLDLSVPDFLIKNQDIDRLLELFTRFEFKSWINKLKGNNKAEQKSTNYQIVLTKDDFLSAVQELKTSTRFAFDTETTSLDPIDAELVGISFATEIGTSSYIPLGHNYEGAPVQLDIDFVLSELRPLFSDPRQAKLGQNLKYDIGVLSNYDVEINGELYDTMLESYLTNSSNNQHDKESLALRYLGTTITTYEDLVGKGVKQIPFSLLSLDRAAPYAAFDSDLVLQLHEALWKDLAKNDKVQWLYKNIEMPLIQVLAKMERTGVKIDSKFLTDYSLKLGEKMHTLEQSIYLKSGAEFNINSPLQLQEILYTKLSLPILQKTPTGQPSTAEAVLQELADEYELPRLILEYRSLAKLKSTYTDSLPKQVNSKTGRVHTSYNQAVTTTGRLSSTNPNLQNIPIRTEEGRKIRTSFIARDGYKIISADYSQIELRIMAHLSGDKNLVQAFREGADIHRMVASEIFGIDQNQVTDNNRRDAKTINFGLIYGMSAFGLAKRIGMSNSDAKRYIDLYFERYPGVKRYMDEMKRSAYDHGFVESIFGRRVYTSEIRSKNFPRRQAAERAAINAPIQGSAADIIKLAMINIDSWIKKSQIDAVMIMQVHDELVFEVAEGVVSLAIAEITKRMEDIVNLSIPMVVDVGSGNNWNEAH